MPKTKIAVGLGVCLLAAAAGWAQGDGKAIFLDKCSICHGEDGAGKTAKGKKLKVKDVHVTSKSESEADMVKIVTDGKGKDMDSFSKDLSPAQIRSVVEYYRSLAK
ncbi:MAG TPA: c-type cytochrome [Bryobacteraceae bacterium]|nr:c-type cytochrome [Bryobacteraceae bacterium]